MSRARKNFSKQNIFLLCEIPMRKLFLTGVRLRTIFSSRWKMNKKRPKHLALHKIKLPLPGFVSILHRVSGLLLFISLPLLLWLLQASLNSIESYTCLVDLVHNPLLKLFLLGLLWAFLHHFCAGIRYLLIDIHVASTLAGARLSSKLVMLVSLTLTLILGVALW
jgi:succinate dehydrogenase / fumarate reductase cytochrome b subunit